MKAAEAEHRRRTDEAAAEGGRNFGALEERETRALIEIKSPLVNTDLPG